MAIRKRNREADLAYAKKYQADHPEQVAAYNKRYRAEHPEYFKAKYKEWREAHQDERNAYMKAYHTRQYHKRYSGIDKATYLEMCAAQQGLCLICQRKRRLAIDHCHATGKVRGLLCYGCNTVLGLMADNCEFLHRAIQYLKRPLV